MTKRTHGERFSGRIPCGVTWCGLDVTREGVLFSDMPTCRRCMAPRIRALVKKGEAVRRALAMGDS